MQLLEKSLDREDKCQQQRQIRTLLGERKDGYKYHTRVIAPNINCEDVLCQEEFSGDIIPTTLTEMEKDERVSAVEQKAFLKVQVYNNLGNRYIALEDPLAPVPFPQLVSPEDKKLSYHLHTPHPSMVKDSSALKKPFWSAEKAFSFLQYLCNNEEQLPEFTQDVDRRSQKCPQIFLLMEEFQHCTINCYPSERDLVKGMINMTRTEVTKLCALGTELKGRMNYWVAATRESEVEVRNNTSAHGWEWAMATVKHEVDMIHTYTHVDFPNLSHTQWCWKQRLEEFRSLESICHYLCTTSQSLLEELDTECHETVCHAVVSISHFTTEEKVSLLHLLKSRHLNVFARPDKYGNVPLHIAVGKRSTAIVQQLIIICPATIRVTNHDGATPIDLAFGLKHKEILECLLRGAIKDDPNDPKNLQLLQSLSPRAKNRLNGLKSATSSTAKQHSLSCTNGPPIQPLGSGSSSCDSEEDKKRVHLTDKQKAQRQRAEQRVMETRVSLSEGESFTVDLTIGIDQDLSEPLAGKSDEEGDPQASEGEAPLEESLRSVQQQMVPSHTGSNQSYAKANCNEATQGLPPRIKRQLSHGVATSKPDHRKFSVVASDHSLTSGFEPNMSLLTRALALEYPKKTVCTALGEHKGTADYSSSPASATASSKVSAGFLCSDPETQGPIGSHTSEEMSTGEESQPSESNSQSLVASDTSTTSDSSAPDSPLNTPLLYCGSDDATCTAGHQPQPEHKVEDSHGEHVASPKENETIIRSESADVCHEQNYYQTLTKFPSPFPTGADTSGKQSTEVKPQEESNSASGQVIPQPQAQLHGPHSSIFACSKLPAAYAEQQPQNTLCNDSHIHVANFELSPQSGETTRPSLPARMENQEHSEPSESSAPSNMHDLDEFMLIAVSQMTLPNPPGNDTSIESSDHSESFITEPLSDTNSGNTVCSLWLQEEHNLEQSHEQHSKNCSESASTINLRDWLSRLIQEHGFSQLKQVILSHCPARLQKHITLDLKTNEDMVVKAGQDKPSEASIRNWVSPFIKEYEYSCLKRVIAPNCLFLSSWQETPARFLCLLFAQHDGTTITGDTKKHLDELKVLNTYSVKRVRYLLLLVGSDLLMKDLKSCTILLFHLGGDVEVNEVNESISSEATSCLKFNFSPSPALSIELKGEKEVDEYCPTAKVENENELFSSSRCVLPGGQEVPVAIVNETLYASNGNSLPSSSPTQLCLKKCLKTKLNHKKDGYKHYTWYCASVVVLRLLSSDLKPTTTILVKDEKKVFLKVQVDNKLYQSAITKMVPKVQDSPKLQLLQKSNSLSAEPKQIQATSLIEPPEKDVLSSNTKVFPRVQGSDYDCADQTPTTELIPPSTFGGSTLQSNLPEAMSVCLSTIPTLHHISAFSRSTALFTQQQSYSTPCGTDKPKGNKPKSQMLCESKPVKQPFSTDLHVGVVYFANSDHPLEVLRDNFTTYSKCCPRHDIQNIVVIASTCPASEALGPKRRYSSNKDLRKEERHSQLNLSSSLSREDRSGATQPLPQQNQTVMADSPVTAKRHKKISVATLATESATGTMPEAIPMAPFTVEGAPSLSQRLLVESLPRELSHFHNHQPQDVSSSGKFADWNHMINVDSHNYHPSFQTQSSRHHLSPHHPPFCSVPQYSLSVVQQQEHKDHIRTVLCDMSAKLQCNTLFITAVAMRSVLRYSNHNLILFNDEILSELLSTSLTSFIRSHGYVALQPAIPSYLWVLFGFQRPESITSSVCEPLRVIIYTARSNKHALPNAVRENLNILVMLMNNCFITRKSPVRVTLLRGKSKEKGQREASGGGKWTRLQEVAKAGGEGKGQGDEGQGRDTGRGGASKQSLKSKATQFQKACDEQYFSQVSEESEAQEESSQPSLAASDLWTLEPFPNSNHLLETHFTIYSCPKHDIQNTVVMGTACPASEALSLKWGYSSNKGIRKEDRLLVGEPSCSSSSSGRRAECNDRSDTDVDVHHHYCSPFHNHLLEGLPKQHPLTITWQQEHKDRIRTAAELLHAQDYQRIFSLSYEGRPPPNLPPEIHVAYVFITGLAYYKLGNNKDSLSYLQQCLQLAEEYGREGDVALSCIYIGDIEFAQRSYLVASEQYQRALHHYSRDTVSINFQMTLPTQSVLCAKCGCALENASKVVDAIAAYEEAIARAESKKDKLSAHTSLGNLFQSVGENARAVTEYKHSIQLATDLQDFVSLGWAHGNMGNAYLGLFQRDRALDHFKKSLDLTVDHEPTPQAIGRAYNNLGIAYQSLNELEKAEEFYDLSLSQAIYGNDIPGQARVYGNIGNLLMIKKECDRAVPHYTEVLLLSQDKSTVSTTYHNRGCAYYEWAEREKKNFLQRDAPSTAPTATKPLFHGPQFEDCEPEYRPPFIPKSIEKYYVQGTKDLDFVIKHHEESLHSIKGSPKGLSLSVSLFETNSRTFHRKQDCLVNMGKFEEALLTAEQSRARTLGELLLKRRGPQLEQQLTSPPSLEQLKAVVARQDCPVVYLSYTGARLLGWVFCPSPSQPSLNMFEVPLSDSEFDGKSFDYHLRYSLNEALIEKSFEMYKPFKYDEDQNNPVLKLYDLVAQPVMTMLRKLKKDAESADQPPKKTQKIIIIPDSYTNLLPMTCLLNRSGGKFWGDDHYFQIMPSLLTMGILDQLPTVSVSVPVEHQQMLCVVGNPTIPMFTYNGEEWNLGKLPHATKEAEWVSHILNCTPILHKQATKSVVMGRIMNSKVIHLATHGSAAAGFLAFAGVSSSFNETVEAKQVLIYSDEIEGLSITPALVVLSGYNSGRGIVKADGIQGMARAFILAGAQAVLTSLWELPDESACVFMQFFYQFLVDGLMGTEALHKAILSVRCFSKFSQYIHWSGYQLTGREIQFSINRSSSTTELTARLGNHSIFPQLEIVKQLETAFLNNPRLPTDVQVLLWYHQLLELLFTWFCSALQVLRGSPGVKPSEPLKDFIHLHHQHFRGGIFWINCRSPQLVEASVDYITKVRNQ